MHFINIILSFFYQIKFWKDWFLEKVNNGEDKKIKWIEPFTLIRPLRSFYFFIYLIFLFFPFAIFCAMIIPYYILLSPLGIFGINKSNNKKLGFFQFLMDQIIYKSQLYLILFTLSLITQSYTFLGLNGLSATLIATLIVGFIFHIYNQYIPLESGIITQGLVNKLPTKKIPNYSSKNK